MAEWEPRLDPYARGCVIRARPLWGTGVVPAMRWGDVRCVPVLRCTAGGPLDGFRSSAANF